MEVTDPAPTPEAELFTSVAPVDAEELEPEVEAKVSGRPRQVAQAPAAAAAAAPAAAAPAATVEALDVGFTPPTSEAEFGPVEETKVMEAAAPSAASTVAASNESSRESGERRLVAVAATAATATPEPRAEGIGTPKNMRNCE
eukprot:s2478_g13.t1